MQTKAIRSTEDLEETSTPIPSRLTLAQLTRLDEVYKLPACDRRVLERLREEAEHAERVPMLRGLLARLDAEEAAEREAHYESLILSSSETNESEDDHLIIGDPARFGQERFFLTDHLDDREREVLVFRNPGFVGCHWIAAEVADAAIARTANKRLPERHFRTTPSDLLRALLSGGNFVDHRVNQRLLGQTTALASGQATLQTSQSGGDVDYRALLQFASEAVDGCWDLPALQMWLESAEQGEGEHYVAFAAKLRSRIEDLGGDESEEDEEEDEDLYEAESDEALDDTDEADGNADAPAAAVEAGTAEGAE